ncbi:MAG: IS66 family transposase [Actinomycetota bacterium]|nr:IS66 family transposase [Actinomycetota bacterium]
MPELLPSSPGCDACASRDAVIAELIASNARLVERVTTLERAAGRNSGNSGMPPSTDDLPGRRAPAPRRAKGSGRGRGKQPGAAGSALPWVVKPDEHVPHRPDGDCACGADLAGALEMGVERSHQTHDLPEIRVVVRQHDIYRVRCGCGREHVATLPGDVSPAPSSYGLNLRSLVVYLLVYQHVPVARCVELIADLTGGTGPSTGFVHGMLDRAAATLHEVIDLIKTLITLSHVVGFDETTLKTGPAGTKRHVLSAVTELYSLFGLGGRDLDSFRDFDVLPEFAGIAVHDRYQNYYNQGWAHLAGHQACAAHLLRDFTDAAEAYPDAEWPEQAKRALRGLIHAFNTARDTSQADIPKSVQDPLISSFRHAVRVGLSQVRANPGPRNATKQPPGRVLLEFCRDRETDVLRFTTDTRIWPTNNISERSLRPNKTQQKISGRLTSEIITQDRLDIRSYIDTMRKHGVDVLTGIRDALTGNPWQPPIPLLT